MFKQVTTLLNPGETCSTLLTSCGAKAIWIRQPLVTLDFFFNINFVADVSVSMLEFLVAPNHLDGEMAVLVT